MGGKERDSNMPNAGDERKATQTPNNKNAKKMVRTRATNKRMKAQKRRSSRTPSVKVTHKHTHKHTQTHSDKKREA